MSDFARVFVARHPYWADVVDNEQTNAQAELLRANGLDAVNVKVLESPFGEVLDAIAEHNMGAMLARCGFVNLEYEPATPRPVDFIGVHRGRTYRSR